MALENILYENNKVALQVNFIVNKKVMKKIKLLTSKNVSFKDDFWKGIIIEPSDSFKNSEYYNNPDSAWSGEEKLSIYYKQLIVFNTWFVHDVLNPAKNTFSDLVNRNVSSQIHSLNYKPQKGTDDLTLEELNKVFSKIQTDKTYWSKMFNITMPEGVSYEWVNSSSSNKFTPSGNNASFKFRVTRDGVSKELELNLKIKKDDDSNQDVKDLNKIRELIEIDNDPKNPLKSAEKILELIKVKEKGKTHNQVNSKDAIEAFNNLYSLPKIGKYEIYAKELIEYKNIVNSNVGGTAKIFFWIKENGVPIQHRNITTTLTESAYKDKYSKTIHYFKPLSYRDLKPKNGKEWFDSSDFLETSEISVEDKNLINSINSSNFEYRRVDGSISRNNNKQFALVDPKDIVEQKAFDMLNYVLKLNAAVDREENNTSGFTNEKPGATADDKPINSSTSNIDWYTSENNIKNANDTPNNQNLSSIANNYFMYFYDVTSDSDMSLSFKLGFINKQDNNKRYTSGNVITLINLKNDYKQNLYPELLLNRIKLSDFTFNPGSMSANDFQNKVKTGSNDVNRMFTWQNDALSYNNFKLDPTRIQIAESKKIEANNGINSIYVKFKYTNPISNKTYVGNNWYKISGFTSANPLSGDDEFTFANQNLKTILHSTTHITRERILEPYYKDLLWSFNTKQEKAYWILKDKYLEHTLLKSGASNRKLKINLFGNQLIQDARRLARISDLDKNYSFEFDFEKLISGQTLFYKQQTRTYNRESDSSEYPKISFIIKASYIVGEGVKFELELENKEYKLFLGNPYAEAITSKELNGPRYGEFLKEKAFLLSYAGAQVSVIYDNSLQHEEFGQKTNQFSYKHLDYNQENQPITFYTPEEVINSGMYNPNQNVSYELHNGYLQDQEYIHSSWKNIELVNNVRARSFAFSQGTATQFAKVNNDPNDYKYYIITNNHVEHISNISEVQGDKLAKKETRRYITKTSNNFGNDVDAGFSYWDGLNTANRIPIEVLWSGVDQINKNGIHSPGLSVDITVFAVDVKELIENAQKSGKFDLKEWFENWSTLNNTNLDFSGVKKGVYFGQNLKRFGMSGFPYGKQSGYFLNRASSSASAVGLIRQNGYAPTFYNAGNSGTGVLGENNEYISTINSGAPLTFLQSWNNENTTMNYFGINYDNEHPLDLKNTNSLAAQIIRWHLTKPSEVSMPWFLRDIKKEK
ncbi:MGA_1079 family surface serine endopeptidase [Mycoplasmopsis canis]|uniref:MGA_1079 family surface serine endopeptidase n=1 Tax=Mycoplasmopsis canis TaxID=29555 RepID=UPI0012D48F94|nr:hypothetical protein [Mycoplasmopsis canis]